MGILPSDVLRLIDTRVGSHNSRYVNQSGRLTFKVCQTIQPASGTINSILRQYGFVNRSCPGDVFERGRIPAWILYSVGVLARVTKDFQQHQFHVVKTQALGLQKSGRRKRSPSGIGVNQVVTNIDQSMRAMRPTVASSDLAQFAAASWNIGVNALGLQSVSNPTSFRSI